MDDLIIRECEITEAEKLCEINREAFGYDYPLEKTKMRLEYILKRDTDKIYVSCIGGSVVSYIHGSDYECTYSDSLKNIMAIAVDENCRGKGIGRALLCAVEKWALDGSCAGSPCIRHEQRKGAWTLYTLRLQPPQDAKEFFKAIWKREESIGAIK